MQARDQHEQIIHEANQRANGMIETAQSEINSQKNVQSLKSTMKFLSCRLDCV